MITNARSARGLELHFTRHVIDNLRTLTIDIRRQKAAIRSHMTTGSWNPSKPAAGVEQHTQSLVGAFRRRYDDLSDKSPRWHLRNIR